MNKNPFSCPWQGYSIAYKNKKTEEKAKVVAALWGKELIQFHSTLQI